MNIETNQVQDFWEWFSKNADLYFHFEKNQDYLFGLLKSHLSKIDPNLVFEFSSIKNDSREFVISADGIVSSFPAVKTVVSQAPTIKGWEIVAFRQPRKYVHQIQYQGLNINKDDIYFRYEKDNGKIGIELHIRNFYESPEWTAGIFILLDNILGEYHTEMSLSYINKKTLNENEISILFPITFLPKIIQEYSFEINN